MSRSIYIELTLIFFMFIFVRDIRTLYIVSFLLLVYSYLKRYIDKRDLLEVVNNWKKYLEKENYYFKEKKFGSSKVKKLINLFEDMSEKERQKAIEIIVATERMDALKDQMLTIVKSKEKNLQDFLRDIKRGIDINIETRGEFFVFSEEFNKLIEINKLNTLELNNISNSNIERKENINLNIKGIGLGLERINILANKIAKLEGHTPSLFKALEEVKGIVSLVEKVVKKTELLSLNASVEASRAGEAGKGFGVVASEIISLANESRGAINEIESYIALLNNEFKEIIVTITETRDELEKVKITSKNIENSLNLLNEEFESIEKELNDIEKNSDIEREILLDVDKRLSRVQKVAHEGEIAFRDVEASIKIQKKDIELLNGVTEYLEKATEDIKELGKDIDLSKLLLNSKGVEEDLEREKSALTAFAHKISLENYDALDSYLGSRVKVEAIWINDLNGNFVVSIPKAGINNGRKRPWFRETLKSGEYQSEVYISAISKKPCITLARCLYKNSEDRELEVKKVEGIIGVDISLA